MKPRSIQRGLLGLLTYGGVPDGMSPDHSRYRKSPDPKTGGSFPLPSFDEDGGYLAPTPVPMPGGYLAPKPPANTLMPSKPLSPEALKKLLSGLKKVKDFPI